jgi:hypothetical protein
VYTTDQMSDGTPMAAMPVSMALVSGSRYRRCSHSTRRIISGQRM